MHDTGFVLVTEARRAGVNPYLIAAIAGKESSYGAAMCEPYNAWGLGSCGRAWHPPRFRSWRQAIRYMAWDYLRVRYLGRARDVFGMAASYCPGCGSWASDVAAHMRRLGSSGTAVGYPT